jgi:hypothetical protein
MSAWAWTAIGVVSFLLVSLLTGLAIGAILRDIGRRISELQESEDWTMLPPSRAPRDDEGQRATPAERDVSHRSN